MDPFAPFKEAQKQGWAHFAPLETFTTPTAARLVNHARVVAGQRVLDVACGTGVVAITAA
jgi:tRNA G10  N-methylase Trm11